ncbi:FimV/HubP family polar landmark protein [Endozoicomonas sp. 8E]|uniref:FimV/HubP family polar landmark protein n=1 Tax=Endozoicomonas sp. 8E TaxID=3035692 RepID=UPI0029391471|nr:FimV/HubP family polar landmark protein [Endozoicomonas sp. 8E]WOG25841.1 FimV/HubP family polar landmark protein [Endozoicomonas sp. 8E]
MKLQKLVAAMVISGAMGSGLANALGLGEVRLNSALNQPLDAEIELLQVRELTRNEILPNLASRADFQRAGLDRPFSLTGLKFKTILREDGTGYIHVTSSQVVREPFLNFLLEVHWPSGRLLREYTMLLDPPAFSQEAAAPVNPASTQTYNGGFPEPSRGQSVNPFDQRGYSESQSSSYQPEESARPIQATPVREEPVRTGVGSYSGPGQRDTYEVQPNDSLWNIARSVRPASDLSIQQTMLALQKKNSQAFVQNNINRLKKGQVLRLPDRDEIEQVSFQDAVGEVARQNREWQARLEQLDATRRSSAESGGKGAGNNGRLSIVATNDSSGTGSDLGRGSADAATTALQNELAMTREKMDNLTRENEELKSRLKDLDDQISTLKRLIDLKDDQMAALTQQPAGTPAQKAPETRPVPVAEQPLPESEPGFLSFLFGHPLYLALSALLPLGLIVALLVYRRRKEEEDEIEVEEESSLEPMSLIPDEPQQDDQEKLELDETLEIDEDILLEDEEPEETTQQTDDAISEADIYIAYGRFPQAVELLEKAIENEPDRSDLRLKLLEVHSENNDLDNFKAALAGVESLDDQDALRQADAYKARFPAEAFSGDATPQAATEEEDDDFEQFDLNEALSDESDVDPDGELGDLEFDLDDLEFNDEPTESSDDLDFQLDDLEPEEGEDDTDTSGSLEELELPSESDVPVQEEVPAPVDDLDDLKLELDEGYADAEEESLSFDDGLPDLESVLEGDDLEFLSDDDEAATKLDLARAYIDMGDTEGARDILQEVLESGSDEQKREAQALMEQAV